MRDAKIQISLLSLLLATALVGLSIVHWQLARKADGLESTISQLRNELGYLNVEDPSKVYVRQVESTEPLTWKYRVYLPSDTKFRLHRVEGRGPKGAAPDRFVGRGGAGSSPSLTGRFTMVIAVTKDPASGQSYLQIKTGGFASSGAIDDGVLERIHSMEEGQRLHRIWTHEQAEFSPNEVVETLRLVQPSTPGMEEGLIVWFQHFDEAKEAREREARDAVTDLVRSGPSLLRAGQYEEAIAVYQEALEIYAEHSVSDSREVVSFRRSLGELYKLAGQPDVAVPHLEAYLEYHPENAFALILLGGCRLALGEAEEAENHIRKSLEIRASRDPESWQTASARSGLGACLVAQQRFEEAEPLLLEGFTGMSARQRSNSGKRRLREAAQYLVDLYEEWGKPSDAAKWRAEFEKLASGDGSQVEPSPTTEKAPTPATAD